MTDDQTGHTLFSSGHAHFSWRRLWLDDYGVLLVEHTSAGDTWCTLSEIGRDTDLYRMLQKRGCLIEKQPSGEWCFPRQKLTNLLNRPGEVAAVWIDGCMTVE